MAKRGRPSNTGQDAVRELGGDTSKIVSSRDDWPGYVPFGSSEHGAMIGIDPDGKPDEQAKLQRALDSTPVPTAPASKRPVNGRNYPNDAEVKFGFVRRGGQGQGQGR